MDPWAWPGLPLVSFLSFLSTSQIVEVGEEGLGTRLVKPTIQNVQLFDPPPHTHTHFPSKTETLIGSRHHNQEIFIQDL